MLRCNYCGKHDDGTPIEWIDDVMWHRTCVYRELSRRERVQIVERSVALAKEMSSEDSHT